MELQILLNKCWKLVEDENFDGTKFPDLDKCQAEINRLETICLNYLLIMEDDKFRE